METAAAPADLARSTPPARSVWPFIITLLFLGLLWLQVVKQLKPEWSFNPQYAYGWTVPFVAIFLIWKRWGERPAATQPHSWVGPILLAISCALFFLPIRFVAEANPDWRLLSWTLALVAVTMSLSIVFLAGGTSWLRHFAFPFLFFLVAVPWPTHLEQFVVQNLMHAVTTINVALLNLVGLPALQLGNVIEVGTGLIGIEEACSGVRSLQATLMISLFLGELYSFNVTRRFLLVLAGAVLAFLCNLVRTFALVWIGAKRGHEAIEAWHDPAGLTILLVCLAGLWLLSLFLRRGSEATLVAIPGKDQLVNFRALLPVCIAFILWIGLAEVGTQLWYGRNQSALASSRWAINWPGAEPAYKNVAIAEETKNLLRYDEGGGASWDASDGHRWMMYFFRWFPGRTAALFVKIHRPDICLPASGMSLTQDDGIRLLNINGVNLPVRSYRFDQSGSPLHVFYCYWDARSSYETTKAAEEEDWSVRGRLRAAWQGRREIGAQMLEVVVWGYEHDAEADEALRTRLAQIIKSL